MAFGKTPKGWEHEPPGVLGLGKGRGRGVPLQVLGLEPSRLLPAGEEAAWGRLREPACQ